MDHSYWVAVLSCPCHFSYVHSVLNYDIMFWGNSPHSKTIFKTQKRIVRIIMKAKAKDFCREMFCKLGILTLHSQYIYSTLMLIVKHRHIYTKCGTA